MGAMRTMDRPPKFLSMSSIGLNDGYNHAKDAWGRCVLCCTRKVFLKECFADMEAAEQAIELARPALNITIVRATILSDKDGYSKNFMLREKSYSFLEWDERGSARCCGRSKVSFMVDRQHVAEAFLDLCETHMR